MTIEIRNPEVEALIHRRLQTGKFKDVEELLLHTLSAEHGQEVPVTRSQLAGQRIRELRRGITLGDTSIKELIEEGRE